jgi:hypothetical protein
MIAIMPRVLKELGLISLGLALGVGFLFLSSMLAIPPLEVCSGCITFGFPFSGNTITAPYGTALGIEPQFAFVLAFWVALGVIIAEASARVTMHRLRRTYVCQSSF